MPCPTHASASAQPDQPVASAPAAPLGPLGRPELLPRIRAYAALLVRKGCALKPGQELMINAPVDAAAFARIVVEEAYAAGAGHVTVVWNDDAVSRMSYLNEPLANFERVPEWLALRNNLATLRGCAWLHLDGEDPSALKGVDPAKPAAWRKASTRACADYRRGVDFGHNAWCIGGVPTPAWAAAVFPELPCDQAIDRLWDAVLLTARADGPDPQAAWDEHRENFSRALAFMNQNRFTELRYTSASSGTDFAVGLLDRGVWEGGGAELQDGTYFFPNMPTEEVFTSPDCRTARGTVHSAMPLVLQGTVVRDFWFRFEEGRVVDFGAAEGAEVLQQLLDTDEGARRLGECALIPKTSPIRRTGLLFYSTLYDENASCHLALGMGFPECYEGGLAMTKEQLGALGLNDSTVHVDFMIGTDDLAIDGVRPDGTVVPVFRNGVWAWEA